jgi:hypothetical protein
MAAMLRLPALFAAVALVAACSSPAPPPGAPVAPEAARAPATPGDAPAGVHLSYAADEGAIGSEVGERIPGAGLASQGRAGWLLFGPYAPVPAGRYRAVIRGSVLPDHGGHVHVDVAHSKGAVLVAVLELDPAALVAGSSGGDLVVLPFELPQAVDDLELRLRVDAASRVSVRSIQIDSLH